MRQNELQRGMWWASAQSQRVGGGVGSLSNKLIALQFILSHRVVETRKRPTNDLVGWAFHGGGGLPTTSKVNHTPVEFSLSSQIV